MNRNVTLRQFRYFVAVAELASVAAASRELNIAQSAITKSILDLHGSRMTVDSRVGVGTSFGFTLPAARLEVV